MIRSPLGLRLVSGAGESPREAIRRAAQSGARGVMLEAVGELAPSRLSETGRRELRHILSTMQLSLIGLALPTRRPFDTLDQLDDRLARFDRGFALAYELGTRLAVAEVGGIPPDAEAERRGAFDLALKELGRRADHRGVRLAMETGPDPGSALRSVLDGWNQPGLSASVDPSALMKMGHDPAEAAVALGPWVAHAYGADAPGKASGPSHPRGFGFATGVLDWESYLGSLEEIDYRGWLTFRTVPGRDMSAQFREYRGQVERF
ncbi:MAG: sugar phosphate isomerase/epimerase family protein [Isosphaeraceae bacterium]